MLVFTYKSEKPEEFFMRKRRLISVVLVLVMLFSLPVSAFAAGNKFEEAIVDEAVFSVHNYSESKTVYIEVYIENYPELTDISFISSVANKLYEKQAEYADESFVLMSEKHIAGELALHILLFRLFYLLGGSNESSMFNKYYNGAKDAELNIDEARISPVLIEMVGTLILTFGFNLDLGMDMDIGIGDLIGA